MERSLALMAGAGVLPGRAAAEARRQGWRVVAFAFDEAPGLDAAADVVQETFTRALARLDTLRRATQRHTTCPTCRIRLVIPRPVEGSHP